ncbi:MAG: hypothetical protein ACD_76C00018G0004 [uncultured bacterium]|nr:MAG: hypothetical protein ACD_76C00018G0004 [uncultured bacterium]HBD05034.1 phosphoglycerate kinase [Candidatus Uhrbacteria bacterium]
MRQIRDIRFAKDLRGKKVLLRLDLNRPTEILTILGKIGRISKSCEDIRFLLKQGASVIIISHWGDPQGFDKRLSMESICKRMSRVLRRKIKFVPDTVGEGARAAVGGMKPGEVIMLENLRFNPGEKTNDKEFASRLASLADIYVNSAFGVSHRKHASLNAITKFIPSYAGILLQKEVNNLAYVMHQPNRPFTLVLGGSKISTKIGMVKHLIDDVDHLLIGGALANTILAAKGVKIGKSLCDTGEFKEAKKIIQLAGDKLLLPVDAVVSNKRHKRGEVKDITSLLAGDAIMDIGPLTTDQFKIIIGDSQTIVWNGPLGVAEKPAFENGSLKIAHAIAAARYQAAYSIVGGGNTMPIIKKSKMEDHFSWVSTGGGAMLAFLAGEPMPGIEPLIE